MPDDREAYPPKAPVGSRASNLLKPRKRFVQGLLQSLRSFAMTFSENVKALPQP